MWYLCGPFSRQKFGDIKQKVQAHVKIAQKMGRTFWKAALKYELKYKIKNSYTHIRGQAKIICKDQDNIVYIICTVNFYTSNK